MSDVTDSISNSLGSLLQHLDNATAYAAISNWMPISDRSHIIQTAFMRCCCHQATDLHAMGFVASNFLLLRPPSAPRTSNNFFVSLSTSSIILYMKEKKIIISECISATDRNNEFQLRVLLLRDEMLLRSVFSVWAKISDFSYSISQNFEFSRQNCL